MDDGSAVECFGSRVNKKSSRTFRQKYWGYGLLLLVVLAALGAVTWYRAVLGRRIQARLDSIRREHLPVTLSDLNGWYSQVAPQENAAFLIDEAAGQLSAPVASARATIKWPRPGVPLSPDLRRQLEGLLATNQIALRLIHQIGDFKHCRFPLDMNRGYELLLPHLASCRRLVELLRVEASLFSEDGDLDQALKCFLDGLRVARALAPEPILISQMVRKVCVMQTVAGLQRLLTQHRLAESQLRVVLAALLEAEADDHDGIVRGLVAEQCLGLDVFQMPCMKTARLLDGGPVPVPDTTVMAGLLGLREIIGLRERDLLFYLESMLNLIQASRLPSPENIARGEQVEKRISQTRDQGKKHLLSFAVLPSVSNVLVRAAESTAVLRAAQTAVELEYHRLKYHGQLPGDLNQMASAVLSVIPEDPFTGRPLHLRKQDKGYCVYSVGPDLADNSGLELDDAGEAAFRGVFSSAVRSAPRPRDVTFTVER
jgi:hypothetical protein